MSAVRSTGSKFRCASSGRFSASVWARRCLPNNWAHRSRELRRAGGGRLLSDPPDRGGHARLFELAGACLSLAWRGIQLPHGANCSPKAMTSRCRRISRSCVRRQVHPDVTYAMMHRWTTRGCVRMEQPGAHPRLFHFEGRAVHDVIERAWLEKSAPVGSGAHLARSCSKPPNSRTPPPPSRGIARVFEHLSKSPDVIVLIA